MKQFRLFALLAGFVLVLGGALSATALALPTVLPLESQTGQGEQIGTSTFKTTNTTEESVSCKENTPKESLFTINSTGNLGSFHIDWHKCLGKISGAEHECNSLGDPTAGLILLGGEWHLVDDHLTELGVAILFLINSFHLECSSLALLLITGDVLCLLVKPVSGLATLFEFRCEAVNGVPTDKTWWNDGGTEQTAKLESALNGGKAREAGETGLLLLLMLKSGKNTEVEVHL